jgi:hypothetical protein
MGGQGGINVCVRKINEKTPRIGFSSTLALCTFEVLFC